MDDNLLFHLLFSQAWCVPVSQNLVSYSWIPTVVKLIVIKYYHKFFAFPEGWPGSSVIGLFQSVQLGDSQGSMTLGLFYRGVGNC